MNISQWNIEKIMRLPDWCFGNRFEVFFRGVFNSTQHHYRISNVALPNTAVIWEFYLKMIKIDVTDPVNVPFCNFALGDVLPVGGAQYTQLEQLWKDTTELVYGDPSLGTTMHLTNMRKVIYPQGRRIVARFGVGTGITWEYSVGFVISGMPTEVHDWLIYRA